MENEFLTSAGNVQIIKKGFTTFDGIKFKEYQIVATQYSTNLETYSYALFTVHKSSFIALSVISPTKNLEQNRKRIADIVGSISTKK